jgi:hypothetical protein
MQGRDAARGLFVIAEIENPGFVFVGTNWIPRWEGRIALPSLFAAVLDQFADIHRSLAANHNVIAAGAECVPSFDRHKSFAGMTDHLEPANDAPPNQVTVMESVLINNVPLEPVEIVFGEQLSGKEARPAETFKTAANRTANDCGCSGSCRSECHKILLPDNSPKN